MNERQSQGALTKPLHQKITTQIAVKLLGLSLMGLWLSGVPLPVSLSAAWANPAAEPIPEASVVAPADLARYAQANVLYLGETHDNPLDHDRQLTVIRQLAQEFQRSPQSPRRLAIALEMFQRPYQWALDAYLAGKLTEAELLEKTQYQRRWGYDWELYAPIVRFAQQQRIALIALNTPTEVTRKVGRQGLASLTLGDRRWIPPISAIDLSSQTYRQRLKAFFDEIHTGRKAGNFEYFFQAQVLWDETMAERITQALQRSPQSLVVVLVGQGHLSPEGIPARVQRRHQQRLQQIILPSLPATTKP